MVGGRGAKAKGSDYERALAAYFNKAFNLDAYRTPLSGGGRAEALPDLCGTPGIAVEAKRTERLSLHDFMSQAVKNAGSDLPVVITRRSRQPLEHSYVFMRLNEWAQLYRAFLSQQGYAPSTQPTQTDQDLTRKDDPAPWEEKS